MKKIISFVILFALLSSVSAQRSEPNAQICEALTGFLNAVNNGTVKKAIGKLYETNTVGGMEMREYHSLQGFPGAMRTIIVDTNRISKMRYISALLADETVKEQRVQGKMNDALNYYIDQLDHCLTPLKYEQNADRAPGQEFTANFQLSLPTTGLFEMPSLIRARLYLTHKKNADGTYTNQLFLEFRRI